MRRIYRNSFDTEGFCAFEVSYKYSNLFIKSCSDNRFEIFELLKKLIEQLESYISKRKEFLTSLKPIKTDRKAPKIANIMIEAAKRADVGPMAAVAGAIAEEIGRYILKNCQECVIENGGDLFLKLNRPARIGIYTNNPLFKDYITFSVNLNNQAFGVCASSSKIGPSLSKGKADLSVIIDKNTAFADAMATATANMIKETSDIEKAINFAKSKGVIGCLFIKDEKLGIWGNLKLIS
ncbi:UPF0280 family protein [Hippea alviniae]|uniref:UPF0280 family protein n=1 Tax=Hippea alviniae TaxID=1279027 RepID=UPI0003B78B0A|nr:UPF0280 family protein [Hippea alviniae]